MFSALRSRNYRLFFIGQGTSLVGTWMQGVGSAWLVFRLTHSPFLLGVAGFADQVPHAVIAPFTGVLIDRWNRHRVLVITQSLAMVQALALAVLALAGVATVWEVIALNVVLGLVNAFDLPARQAFNVEMVDRREDLPNAIALNSSLVNGARLVGPAAAGLLIGAFGEGACFAANAASFLVILLCLKAMRLRAPGRPARTREGGLWARFAAGLRYVRAHAPIRAVLLLMGFTGLVGLAFSTLLPVVARDVLGGGPHTFGFLTSASGIGSLAGALTIARRRGVLGLGGVIAASLAVFGAGVVGLALSRVFWLSLLALTVAGFGAIRMIASCNTLVQTLVDDDKRGRVMSLYALAFLGTAPFGSLLMGAMAHRLGAPFTLAISGSVLLLTAAAFARRIPALSTAAIPHYRRRGLLPRTGSPAPGFF